MSDGPSEGLDVAGASPSPELHPFRAVRFAAATREVDPDGLLAPPYDVISPAEAEALRAKHPYNAVRLELPEGDEGERYALAARRLVEWLERGVLEEDDAPSVYVYRQTFSFRGETFERRSLLAALRLVPLDAGAVLPHEETHGGPKRDRLALALACRAQLSPVFLLAPDPEGRLVAGLRDGEAAGEAVLEARTEDGIRHRLTRLHGEVGGTRGAELCHAAGAAPLLIADGHHRYETALEVARMLQDSEAASAVLACVVPEGDPGVLLLPTHRALHLPPPEGGWTSALAESFQAERNGGGLRAGSGELALVTPGEPPVRLRPRPDALARAGISGPGTRIGALAFDRLVVRELLGSSAERLARGGELTYHREAAEAREAAGRDGAVFLIAPTRPADVRDAAAAGGGRLPPKTTYFWPKVPAGLLFRRI